MSDLDKLRAFAQAVMEIWPEGVNWDAGDIQDMAVKHGLLVPEIRHEDCSVEGVSTCQCAEYCSPEEFKSGVECFRKTELLNGKAEELL